MDKYYVYVHKKKNGEVFYVGKGLNGRINQTGNRSEFWKRIIKKYGCIKEIIEQNLTEEEAYKQEVKWIKHFKDIGQCEANFTDGGDGVRVEERWWGYKISKAMKGKNAEKGKQSKSYKDVVSKEEIFDLYVVKGYSSTRICKGLGISHTTLLARVKEYGYEKRSSGRKKRPVKCTTDGLSFESITSAASHYGLFQENIRKVLSGAYKTTGGKHFEYI